MTLVEKRLAAEILACCGNENAPIITICALVDFDLDGNKARRIRDRYGPVNFDHGEDSPYETACLEAAYRLIESSPTLRKEWFNR